MTPTPSGTPTPEPRGRTRPGRSPKTHCPHGHEYTPENTFLRKNSKTGLLVRSCRKCRHERQTKYYPRNNAKARDSYKPKDGGTIATLRADRDRLREALRCAHVYQIEGDPLHIRLSVGRQEVACVDLHSEKAIELLKFGALLEALQSSTGAA